MKQRIKSGRVLIVDDELPICQLLKELLEDVGYRVDYVLNGNDALSAIKSEPPDLLLLDIRLPDLDGVSVLKKIKENNPGTAVIIISAFGTVALATEAIKTGAEDFIEKPLEANRVLTTVRNTMEKIELKKQGDTLKKERLKDYPILGNSPVMLKVVHLIDKCAGVDSPVLITGETGTGKELVSRNIHLKSSRCAGPFIAVNCAALPSELIESELFGYEKGAFTDARARKIGYFELAHGGTLLLDEIGDMSPPAQAKVLRFLDDSLIMRLGSVEPVTVDVRIIAATNQDLMDLIRAKQFREDLYHRLNVLPVNLPPLRERGYDIILLAETFLAAASREHRKPLKNLSRKSEQFLLNQSWPGNVRELKHLMEKIVILTDETTIETEIIEEMMEINQKNQTGEFIGDGIEQAKTEFEKKYILGVLNQTGWRLGRTAEMLGVNRTTLFRKIKKLGISKNRR